MQIDLKIRFSTEDIEWLCFRHAIKRAMAGEDIMTGIEDSEHCWFNKCDDCKAESEAREAARPKPDNKEPVRHEPRPKSPPVPDEEAGDKETATPEWGW